MWKCYVNVEIIAINSEAIMPLFDNDVVMLCTKTIRRADQGTSLQCCRDTRLNDAVILTCFPKKGTTKTQATLLAPFLPQPSQLTCTRGSAMALATLKI